MQTGVQRIGERFAAVTAASARLSERFTLPGVTRLSAAMRRLEVRLPRFVIPNDDTHEGDKECPNE